MKKFLASVFSIIAVSVFACSEYPSARSHGARNNDAALSSPSTQATPTAAREKLPCSLTMAGAPDIKGLRLGTTTEQVLALFPGSAEDAEVRAAQVPNKFGSFQLLIRPDKYGSKEAFVDINQITFTLLDGRVLSLWPGTTALHGHTWITS